MSSHIKIAIYEPGGKLSRRMLTFQLKRSLNNERCVYAQPSKVLVIPGTQGDYKKLLNLLVSFGVIDRKQRWIFGDNHLVINGNCFSESNEMIECLWFIYSLESNAEKKGGYIHFLLGGRELSNLNGRWRYEHPNYASSRKLEGRNFSVLYDGNNELWRWLRTKNIVEKIGDTLFMSEGFTRSIFDSYFSLSAINNIVREGMSSGAIDFLVPALEYLEQNERINGEILHVLQQLQINKIIVNQIGATQPNIYFHFENVNVINVNTLGVTEEALLVSEGAFFRLASTGEIGERVF